MQYMPTISNIGNSTSPTGLWKLGSNSPVAPEFGLAYAIDPVLTTVALPIIPSLTFWCIFTNEPEPDA